MSTQDTTPPTTWFVDARLQKWAMVLMLGFFTKGHSEAQLDIDVIGLEPYLQELGSYIGLTSLSLLPVIILRRTLDN